MRSVACGAAHTICVVAAEINSSLGLLMDEMEALFALSNDSSNGVEEASADLKLVCGGGADGGRGVVFGHKVIVSARCRKLEEMVVAAGGDKSLMVGRVVDEDGTRQEPLGGTMMKREVTEVVVWGVEYEALVEVVRHLYCDRIRNDLKMEAVVGMVKAASLLELRRLGDQCKGCYVESITADNVNERRTQLKEMMRAMADHQRDAFKERSAEVEASLRELLRACDEFVPPQSAGEKGGEGGCGKAGLQPLCDRVDEDNDDDDNDDDDDEGEDEDEDEPDIGEAKFLNNTDNSDNNTTTTTTTTTEAGEDRSPLENPPLASDEAKEEKKDEKPQEPVETENKEEGEILPGESTLSKDLETYLNSPRFADILFSVDGHTLYAHRVHTISPSLPSSSLLYF